MKVCLTVTFDANHRPIFPPPNTRLSDELVYLATKFLKAADRGRDYSYDFDRKGDINPTRVPAGVGPIIWAHGLPFFPVYKGYYILCGREHGKWIGWLLNRKERKVTIRFPMWTVGPVVAPRSAVELTRSVERQLRVHKAVHTRDFVTGEEHADRARDVVSTAHGDLAVVPGKAPGGYCLRPIYEIAGYNVHCGPDWENGRAADVVEERVFGDLGSGRFDYAAALEMPYVNQRCPLAVDDDAQMDAGEDGDGMDTQVAVSNGEQDETVCDTGPAVDSHHDDEVQKTQVEGDESTHDDQICSELETKQNGSSEDDLNKEGKLTVGNDDETTDESQDQTQQLTAKPATKKFNGTPWKKLTVPRRDPKAPITKTQQLSSDKPDSIDDEIPSRILGILKRTWEMVNKDNDNASASQPSKISKTTSTCTEDQSSAHPDQDETDTNSTVKAQKIDGRDTSDSGDTDVSERQYPEEPSFTLDSLPDECRIGDIKTHAQGEMEIVTDQNRERRHSDEQVSEAVEGSPVVTELSEAMPVKNHDSPREALEDTKMQEGSVQVVENVATTAKVGEHRGMDSPPQTQVGEHSEESIEDMN